VTVAKTVLISGASVAGPITAYWLRRRGFAPTVVERTPRPRLGLGGHAVDLFAGAVDVMERMGVLAQVEEARTRTDSIEVVRPGHRPVVVPMTALTSGLTAGRLPIGLQLLAPWREEERLLDLAELLERATDRRFVDAAPPVAQAAAA